MKNLSYYINKFDDIEREAQASGKNVLTPDQAEIFKSVFNTYHTNERYGVLDAKSGSGKTTLIRAMVKFAQSKGINLVVTASTGKASSALNGQTIHSYLGLKMAQNENATSKDEALQLTSGDKEVEFPDILIIDEASMIGKKIFSQIDLKRFNFVLFVMDSSQLPPVKEKKVEWRDITRIQYTLTKTLRAKDPKMMQLFEDFRAYKMGEIQDLELIDYVNDENIVMIDYDDLDKMPTNTESCIVAYRNRLVEHFVGKVTTSNHTMRNLNNSVSVTHMVAKDDVPQDNGYFARDFVNEQVFYNGEDVKIELLTETTQQLVDKGYAYYDHFKLSMNKKGNGITITNQNAQIPFNARESDEKKQYLKFPQDDVLEQCTLSIVDEEHFVLIWDGTEAEYDAILEQYFSRLFPHLRISQAIKKYYKDMTQEISSDVPYDIKSKMVELNKQAFYDWFSMTQETKKRKMRWAEFLSAKSVVSARPTTSRTIHKSQGISVPAVVVSDMSFYGASLDAQYVAVTRAKHGLILVANVPKHLVLKEEEQEDEFY
jgi:ATP-dependent exoDNAse (exonuclease V) alpha subunit